MIEGGSKVNKDSVTSIVTSPIVIRCMACQGELSLHLEPNFDKRKGPPKFDLGWRCSDCRTVWLGLDKLSARLGRSDD
jgi:hypothetical protein